MKKQKTLPSQEVILAENFKMIDSCMSKMPRPEDQEEAELNEHYMHYITIRIHSIFLMELIGPEKLSELFQEILKKGPLKISL